MNDDAALVVELLVALVEPQADMAESLVGMAESLVDVVESRVEIAESQALGAVPSLRRSFAVGAACL